jgi:hypothetical protein
MRTHEKNKHYIKKNNICKGITREHFMKKVKVKNFFFPQKKKKKKKKKK